MMTYIKDVSHDRVSRVYLSKSLFHVFGDISNILGKVPCLYWPIFGNFHEKNCSSSTKMSRTISISIPTLTLLSRDFSGRIFGVSDGQYVPHVRSY